MAGHDQGELLARVGAAEPELAARLVLMTLPAAAARIRGTLVYDLAVDGLGTHRVSVSAGRARVDRIDAHANGNAPALKPAGGETDFRMSAEPRALVALASGEARPLGLMLRGVLRVRGKRRRLLRLRRMAGPAIELAEVIEAGGKLDVDALFRALPYAIDPEWTRGYSFAVRYELGGEGGGSWCVEVRDGQPLRVSGEAPAEVEPVATVRVATTDYVRLVTGQLTPNEAMQNRVTRIDGQLRLHRQDGQRIDPGGERIRYNFSGGHRFHQARWYVAGRRQQWERRDQG